ncbi:MAG: substrate-binding domain-containing protein [Planctomycetes bacterium]|nr:substrate-binding domain-containing protein [Planctomycetota bacterium]
MTEHRSYQTKKNWWIHFGWLSLLVIVLLVFTFLFWRKWTAPRVGTNGKELVVYCAAGIRLPVQEAANSFTQEFGQPILLEYASSGDLEIRIRFQAKFGKPLADLYIPANDYFAKKTAADGLTQEYFPLATFNLVLASKRKANLNIDSLDDLLEQNISFVMCNPETAAGWFTQKTLTALGKYEALSEAKKASFPTVVGAANAISTSNDAQVGFIWDTTAHQYDLEIVHLPELAGGTSSTSVNVVTTSENPALALSFARYLSAPETGNPAFARHFFTAIPGDTWSKQPELTFFCGGVNRNAVQQTLQEFEKREGILIRTQFGGCGTLVSTMKGIKSGESEAGFPDVYMTCDKTFYDPVAEDFGEGKDISTTDIIILVRKGNPKGIARLEDLAQNGLTFGTTDPKQSTLGFLSWKLFTLMGLKEVVRDNAIVTTPTAHELVMQMTSHPKLDAVLVYVANCHFAKETCDLIPIDHPLARATQNIGASLRTPYPRLTERLMNALHSTEKSKTRFLEHGFQWVSDLESE